MSEDTGGRPRRVASYELHRCLGRGGFASVYEAQDVGSGEMVALKLLDNADPESARRFDGEVARMRRLEHPSLPRLIDAGREDDLFFLAMSLVDGEPLDVVAAQRRAGNPRRDRPGGWAVKEVLALLEELADALVQCHGQGIIHRDIKPGNILLRADGRPVLVDFGLGLIDEATRVTRAGAMVGTLRYMSPEQMAFDAEVDARSDLFQLGMLAYELLTGSPAFPIPDVPSMGERFQAPVARPSSLCVEVPPALDALVLGLLAADPDRRPQRAQVVRDEVRAIRAAVRGAPRRAHSAPASGGSFTSASRAARFLVPVLSMVTLGVLVLWFATPRAPSLQGSFVTLPAEGSKASPPPSVSATPSARTTDLVVDRLGPGRVRLEMVPIPGGCVRIGTPGAVAPSNMLAETPAHRVCVRAFHLAKYEITQAQYRAVMGVNPSVTKGPSFPVQMISHEDASVFVARLKRLTGRPYRLPSEAEWEYACRAGSEALYPWGDDPERSALYAWTSRNSPDRAQEVGTRQPNGFGLFDMLGNVSEWVADTKSADYDGAPIDGRARQDPGQTHYIVRGGGVDMDVGANRCAVRFSPLVFIEFVGLRVAL